MRKIATTFIALAAVAGMILLSGCGSTTHSRQQQAKKFGRVVSTNNKMFIDDMDKLLLIDQNSRLGKWHTIVIE